MHARFRYLRDEKNMAAKRERSCNWSLAEYIDKFCGEKSGNSKDKTE